MEPGTSAILYNRDLKMGPIFAIIYVLKVAKVGFMCFPYYLLASIQDAGNDFRSEKLKSPRIAEVIEY